MAAELEKLRALPTPRWTLIVTVGLVGLALVTVIFSGSAKEETYIDAAEVSAGIGSVIGSIVLGVWIAGVEYGQGTMRRVLAADPRRGRLLAAKIGLAIGAALGLTVVVWAAATALLPIAASANGASSPAGDILTAGVTSLLANPIYAAIGCAVAVLARSMAGGMTAMLALVFVLDTILTALPIGDISLGSALRDLGGALEGDGGDREVAGAIAVAVIWVTVLLTAAWVRFTRTDVT
ncbi:MAG: hypothetical protein ACR2GL_01250 [Thermoleophilaceae bacterium]